MATQDQQGGLGSGGHAQPENLELEKLLAELQSLTPETLEASPTGMQPPPPPRPPIAGGFDEMPENLRWIILALHQSVQNLLELQAETYTIAHSSLVLLKRTERQMRRLEKAHAKVPPKQRPCKRRYSHDRKVFALGAAAGAGAVAIVALSQVYGVGPNWLMKIVSVLDLLGIFGVILVAASIWLLRRNLFKERHGD